MQPDPEDLSTVFRLYALREVFRPSVPIDDLRLFRGRQAQLNSVMTGIQELGQHVVIYGERGLGKTSLAYVAREVFLQVGADSSLAVRVQCADGESFDSLWRRFARRLAEEVETKDPDYRTNATPVVRVAEEMLLYSPGTLTPEDVTRALKALASKLRVLIIVDEIDRLKPGADSTAIADLIKNLSDEVVRTSLVLVGVADTVTGLISSHPSVVRNIREVRMPRMSEEELRAIVVKGWEQYQTKASDPRLFKPAAVDMVTYLSQGFPYYAHLLAGTAGASAIRAGDADVGARAILESMVEAIDGTSQAIREDYAEAVAARAGAKLEHTLIASALADMDELGYFSASAIAEPLSRLTRKSKSSAHFAHHLKRFSTGASSILEERRWGERKIRYRFRDPLMKPFVLINALQRGIWQPFDDADQPAEPQG